MLTKSEILHRTKSILFGVVVGDVLITLNHSM